MTCVSCQGTGIDPGSTAASRGPMSSYICICNAGYDLLKREALSRYATHGSVWSGWPIAASTHARRVHDEALADGLIEEWAGPKGRYDGLLGRWRLTSKGADALIRATRP